jgi:undecaprenyl-diphosphatase
MEWFQVLVLALIQGITEFLPISSSAHLILVPVLTGWKDQGLAFDVAVHLGTLMAVVLYFRDELMSMTRDWIGSVSGKGMQGDARLAWGVLLGTIPVGLAGLLFKDVIETQLRSGEVIIATTIIFGLLLGYADWRAKQERSEHQIRWLDVLIIGIAQAIALIPGTSRSGITMTAGLMVGLTREGAARFSFLLSIPVIVLAGGLKLLDLIESAGPVDWMVLIVGTLISCVSAFLVIHYFLQILKRIGMWPFVIYRLVLGVFLIFFLGLI